MTREYGTTSNEIGIIADLHDIGRRLDALEAGRRSDNDLPDDEFQKRAGREVGWYPVIVAHLSLRPSCLWWNGARWVNHPGQAVTSYPPLFPDWIGPRLDLPEGR